MKAKGTPRSIFSSISSYFFYSSEPPNYKSLKEQNKTKTTKNTFTKLTNFIKYFNPLNSQIYKNLSSAITEANKILENPKDLITPPAKSAVEKEYYSKKDVWSFCWETYYNNNKLPHLIAILLASIAIGCLPFVYLNLFKLYFDSQISSNYAFFINCTLAVTTWGILRTVLENKLTELSERLFINVSYKFIQKANTKLCEFQSLRERKQEEKNSERDNFQETVGQVFKQHIVIISNIINYSLKAATSIYYIYATCKKTILNIWLTALIIPMFLLAVLRKAPDEQHKKLSNLLITKIRPSYAKLFKSALNDKDSFKLNGNDCLRGTATTELNGCSKTNRDAERELSQYKSITESMKKICDKINETLAALVVYNIYGMPSTSNSAAFAFGFGALTQIKEALKKTCDSLTNLAFKEKRAVDKMVNKFDPVSAFMTTHKVRKEFLKENIRPDNTLPTFLSSCMFISSITTTFYAASLGFNLVFEKTILLTMGLSTNIDMLYSNSLVCCSTLVACSLWKILFRKMSSNSNKHIAKHTNFFSICQILVPDCDNLPINFIGFILTQLIIYIPFKLYVATILSLSISQPYIMLLRIILSVTIQNSINKIVHYYLTPLKTIEKIFTAPQATKPANNEPICINTMKTGKVMIFSEYDEEKHKWVTKKEYISNKSIKIHNGITKVSARNGVGKSLLMKGIINSTHSNTESVKDKLQEYEMKITPQLQSQEVVYFPQGRNAKEETTTAVGITSDFTGTDVEGISKDFKIQNSTSLNITNHPKHKEDLALNADQRYFLKHTILTDHNDCNIDYTKLNDEHKAIVNDILSKDSTYLNKWREILTSLEGVGKNDKCNNCCKFILDQQGKNGGTFAKIIWAFQATLLTVPHIKLLILDEPGNEVDPESRSKGYEILDNLARQNNKKVLSIDHDDKNNSSSESINNSYPRIELKIENGKVSVSQHLDNQQPQDNLLVDTSSSNVSSPENSPEKNLRKPFPITKAVSYQELEDGSPRNDTHTFYNRRNEHNSSPFR